MSLATLEREIVAEARDVLRNSKLRNKDIQEWSTGKVKAEEGEVVIDLTRIGINIAVKQEMDRRNK
jgi:hypothetical protein